MSRNEINEKIDNGEFSLYDKFLYGGIGYGYICMKKNVLRIILSVIFPPFGIILKHLQLTETFPYVTFDGIINLLNNLGDVIYSVLLTCLFWVPGVIYSFQSLEVLGYTQQNGNEEFRDEYGISPDELTDEMVKEFMQNIKHKKKYNL